MTDTTATSRRIVPLGALKLDHQHWTNPRSFSGLDEESLDEFGKDLKAEGIQVPPHVVRVKMGGGDYIDLVADGQRRVRAGLRVFPKNHPIEVIDLYPEPIELTPAKSAEILRRVLNIGHREGLSSYELSEAAEKLRDQGLKLAEIARAVGKSDSWVSRMLEARKHATDKLMIAWKKGEITDEQFKDLAKQKEDDQPAAIATVVETRASGDKATARVIAKELAEKAKPAAGKVNGHSRPAPETRVVKGEQTDLFEKPKAKPEGPKAPSKAVLEDMLALADKTPPTHDEVKGIMKGISFALGFTSPDKLGNPWVTYLARVEGRAVPKRVKAKAPKAVKAKAAGKGKKKKADDRTKKLIAAARKKARR